MNKLPTYELFLEDSDKIALAIVENPAIETDFIYFDSDETIKIEFNKEEMIIKGPALIPNKKIYRNDNFGERNVFMSEKTVREFAEYLINKQGTKFNLGHTDKIIEANLIESYFTNDSNEFGVPKGSWIIALKLKSMEAWEQVKNGEFKGFSIEGIFSNEFSNFNNNFNKNEKMDLKERLIAAVNAVLFNEVKPVETEVEMAADAVPAETVVTPTGDTKPVEEAVQLTPEMIQSMIDDSIMSATEEILKACKEMMAQGYQDTQTEMSAMSAKLEEFSKQPLSQPITETVVNTAKLTSGSDYSYLSGINK